MRNFFTKTMKTARLREDKKLSIRLLVSIGERRNDPTRRANGQRSGSTGTRPANPTSEPCCRSSVL